jgi:hypothetical protein
MVVGAGAEVYREFHIMVGGSGTGNFQKVLDLLKV